MIARKFLRVAALFAAVVALFNNAFCAAAAADARQYYELRVYATSSDAQRQRVNDYWQNAAIPAYNRMGIQPIGVFTEQENSATNKIYVLIPCDSLEIFSAIPAKLAADEVYQKAAAEFLSAPKGETAYDRFESSLLIAFDGMKHISLPPADQRPNIFELRSYLSPSEGKGLNKIKMFESGEINVMKEVGLAPIFYSRNLTGSHLPCLTYLTCGVSEAEHKKHWAAFGSAPVWKQLQADPQYKDNIIGIIRVILKRTSASQI